MNTTLTPPRFPHNTDNVPDELKRAKQWIVCDEEKVPLVATLSGACYAASSTDPTTWRDYETAYTAWLENEWSFAGVGRVITLEEEYVGVDFDDVLDPDTGELEPRAAEIIELLNSYSEISPSLRGVKVWVRAPSLTRAHTKPCLELYPRGRYFTVTGLVFREAEISNREDEIAEIIDTEFPKVSRDRRAYDGPARSIDLLDYLERGGVEIFAEKSDGQAERVYSIRCPWWHEHTGGDVSGTRVGQYASGMTFFRCEHAHCREVRE
jgi:hypothetical protein